MLIKCSHIGYCSVSVYILPKPVQKPHTLTKMYTFGHISHLLAPFHSIANNIPLIEILISEGMETTRRHRVSQN